MDALKKQISGLSEQAAGARHLEQPHGAQEREVADLKIELEAARAEISSLKAAATQDALQLQDLRKSQMAHVLTLEADLAEARKCQAETCAQADGKVLERLKTGCSCRVVDRTCDARLSL